MSFIGKLRNVGWLDMYQGKIIPVVKPNATVAAKTATANLSSSDWNKNVTNTGSSGTIVLTLLTPVGNANKVFRVQVTAAQIVSLSPPAGVGVYLGGSGVDAKDAHIAGVIGNYLDVYCDGANYHITGYSGVATKEA